MAERITVAFQKGGVGKTFISTNLAGGLADNGLDTLLIDLDPQGSLTANLGHGEAYMDPDVTSLDEILLNVKKWDTADEIIITDHEEFDLLPANATFSANRTPLDSSSNSDERLDKVLQRLDHEYDYVIMDTPPSLDAYTRNSIIASKQLVVPVSPIYEMIHSTNLLLEMIEEFELVHDIEIEYLACVLNAVNYSNLSTEDEEMIDWFWETFEEIGYELRERAAFDRSKWADDADTIYSYEEARNCDQFEQFDTLVQDIVQRTNSQHQSQLAGSATGGGD